MPAADGRVLSLLHGWGMNRAIFDPFCDSVGAEFEMVGAELDGHGQTAYRGLGFDAQVAVLAEQLPSSTLVGWSMGGLFAIALARRYPHKFPRLVLVASNPCFVQRGDWPDAVAREVFEDFSRDLVADWRATVRRFIGLQLKGVSDARQLIRRVSGLLEQGGAPRPEALQDGLRLLLTHDARAGLAALEQPVMLVLGERDALVPSAVGAQIRALAPKVRVECVARSAHAPFITHPQLFADLLRGFTQSSPA
jgi:pimeloyl-[acyl-carrier protein] methyl ester esterase